MKKDQIKQPSVGITALQTQVPTGFAQNTADPAFKPPTKGMGKAQVVVSPGLLKQVHLKVSEANKSGDPRFPLQPKYPAQAVSAVLTSFVDESALPSQGISQLAERLSARFAIEFPNEVVDPLQADKIAAQARALAALAIPDKAYALPAFPTRVNTGDADWLLVAKTAVTSSEGRKLILRHLQGGYRPFYYDPSDRFQVFARVEDQTRNR